MDRYLLSKIAINAIGPALIAVVLITGAAQSPTAWAQSAQLMDAFKKYQALEKRGKYAEAIPYAQTFIEFAKEAFGETHQIYVAGLNNLALLYKGQGRCKLQGGKSTGPRTAASRAWVAAANTKHGRRSKAHVERVREINAETKWITLGLRRDGLIT